MAPEQAKGEAAIGPRADVFALGCVLYECLTGVRAFPGANVIAVLANLLTAPTPRPRTRAPHLPRALDAYVARMLSRDPEKRPANGAEAARGLAALMHPRTRGGTVGRAVLGVAIGACLFGGAALLHARLRGAGSIARSTAAGPPMAGSADASPPARAITDFLAPEGTRADAAAEYAAGLQALRDATLERARAHLARAAELEPSLAEAHLRLAVWTDALIGPEESRAHFKAAHARRATLRERDRDFVAAVEPEILNEPPNRAEMERRVQALPHKHPGDAELALLAAGTGTVRGKPADYDRVLALDPRFAYAWWGRARTQLAANAPEAALTSIDACLAIADGSTLCRLMRTRIDAETGDCVAMERDARAVIAVENGSEYGYLRLGHALFANGADREAVHEALRQRVRASAPNEREIARNFDDAQLAAGFGDFTAAEASARALARTTDGGRFEQDHVPATLLLVDMLEERGDTAAAGAVADAFLRRRSGWRPLATRPSDEPQPYLFAAARRAGLRARDEEVRAREAWIGAWRDKIGDAGAAEIWLEGWAHAARDPREAAEAMAALPPGVVPAKIAPLKGWIWPTQFLLAPAGRALLLSGRHAEAAALLRQVTRDCGVLNDAVGHTAAHLALGRALEEEGDTAGACAAYRVVLARWGNARPRSVSAETARARAVALGCPR
jgi:serine/threonine-protein kinase